ncbi:hypothetical protein [Streptomyces sparsogenes]|uniref:Uncharacterized protein n=1 Tax=Streptomyces sparsogenes DSM 40356 TaxID=1331668 RepID=A0A1R1SBI7_9ACTN|nr:hypothetical protein [Streptomyces sparsogenes]OMI35653.1 hypothetical protein SPAR_30291 [Streptomyces sparsogenes DSM 40356]
MADLHLTFSDIGAAGVLLLCLTGQNYSTISTATATHHRADGHTGTTGTAVVDLVKPRRGRDRAHMPTAFSSSAPGRPGGSPHRQFDLHTPFGVYALLVDLAGPARAHVGTDLLLVFFCSKGVEKARGFRTGLPNAILASWSRGANLRADALGEDGLPIPLVVDSRRLRMSWLEHTSSRSRTRNGRWRTSIWPATAATSPRTRRSSRPCWGSSWRARGPCRSCEC